MRITVWQKPQFSYLTHHYYHDSVKSLHRVQQANASVCLFKSNVKQRANAKRNRIVFRLRWLPFVYLCT